MTLGKVALEVWGGAVALSLACLALYVAAGVAASVLTVVHARRRARMPSPPLSELARSCSVSELAEVDEALDRIWAAGRGSTLGWQAR